jgi:exopolysaccharide biosynthesis polyprenyl glycosylphosphotransferase
MMDKTAIEECQTIIEEDIKQKAVMPESLYIGMKRFIDILFSIIGIVLSIPILVIAMIFIMIESKGCILYTQERLGKDNHLFKIYKLRTMCLDAEINGIQWAQKNDPRVTRVGRFLRKTRIDELPQFINVLKGDMSIVGPRPERPYFIDAFSRELPKFNERLAVRPGITGLSQVNGGYDLSPEQKLEKDLFYIQNQSILLDMMIILKTVKIVITFEGSR